MLDPRIEYLAEQIENLKKAILVLAGNLDGVTWRVSSNEERNAGVEIYEKIMQIIQCKKEA